MGKLLSLSGREIIRRLEKHGFVEIRRKGSHVVMQRRIEGTTVTAIVPDHKSVAIGTLSSIIRQSQLPREVFEE